MQRIDEGFRHLKAARAPDLWRDIEGRTPRPLPGPSGPRRFAVAALALAIAGTGSWLAARAFLASDADVEPAEEAPGAVTPRVGPSATFPGAHGGGPLYAFGSVWIPQHGEPPEEDVILRIDPDTLDVQARIPVRSAPGWEIGDSGFAAGADSVWVTGGNGDQAALERIDPVTNAVAATILFDGSFGGDVAVADSSVWVSVFGARGEMYVARVDAVTNDVTGRVAVPGGWIREVFAFDDRIVVHTRGGDEVDSPNTLTVIDGTTAEVLATNDLEEAIFASWDGVVWGGAGKELLRIDPRTAQVVDRRPAGNWISHTSVAGGAGGLWFIGYDANDGADLATELVRYNVEAGEIDASIDVGGDPVAVAVGDGAVWVLGYEGKLTRVDLVAA